MTTSDAQRAIEAVWRIEAAKLIAGLARMVRDVGLAEDLAQDALVIALEQWPETGIPDNPGAWLMVTAKHRAVDRIRRNVRLEHKTKVLGRELEIQQETAEIDVDAALDDDVGDDLLRLIFTACHPVLSTDARVALTLRLLGGLTTDEIARAFLVSEATVAQRIVRAKRTLAEAHVPFEVPQGADRAARFASVLEIVDTLVKEPSLKAYHLLPSVRGDLLTRLGRLDEARAEFVRAAALTRNARERGLLLDRAAACARGVAQ
jgi:RNA polymerase sigma factor (sigma-70 family)